MAGGTLTVIGTSDSGCVADGGDWAVMVGVLLPLATGEEVPSPPGFDPSCGEDLLLFFLRRGLGADDWAYGSYRFPLFDPSFVRPSVRRGGGAWMGPEREVEDVGEISESSASPLYLGMPSAPISTLGGLRK